MKIDSDKYKIYGMALELNEERGGKLVFNSADQFRDIIALVKSMKPAMVKEIYEQLLAKELGLDHE